MNAMILALVLHTTCAPPATEYPTYSEAYHEATKTGKPILVLVSATWCGPCQKMKTSVLPEVRRRGVLKNFSFALVDVDRERKLVQQLGGSGPVPQLVCFRKGKGQWFRSKLVGGRGTDQVEQFLHAAASKHDVKFDQEPVDAEVRQVGHSDAALEAQPTESQSTAQVASEDRSQ